MPDPAASSIFGLFQGGRLPSWEGLSQQNRTEFSQAHVDLMLSLAQRHGLKRLEGFRLIEPQDT